MKKFLIPVTLIVFGAGGAFMINATEKQAIALQDGYRIDELGNCIKTVQKCNTIPTTTCTWAGYALHEKVSDNPTQCGEELFMP